MSDQSVQVSQIIDKIHKLDRIQAETRADISAMFGATSVSYRQMAALPFYREIRVGPGVYTTRLKRRWLRMTFMVRFTYNNAEIYRHSHDCFERIRVVTKGIIDVESGHSYEAGDVIEIHPGQNHHPIGEEGTILIVTFHKDNILRQIARFFGYY